jgi:hypothetical protein
MRPRRKRPRCSCAAEQRHKLAALQSIELHSMPASQTWIVRYRIGEAASGGMGAISQPASCPTEALPRSGGLIPSVLAHRDASISATCLGITAEPIAAFRVV